MKITKAHYAHLRDTIASTFSYLDVAKYRASIIAEGPAKDTEKRVRWNLSHGAGTTQWVCNTLYPYLDDTHIDTALRSIIREIETV